MSVEFARFETEETKDVQFGTCELCYSTSDLVEEFLIFTDGTKEVRIPTGYWSWGDYILAYPLENIVKFATYINSLEIDSLEEFEENFSEYYYDYIETVEENDETTEIVETTETVDNNETDGNAVTDGNVENTTTVITPERWTAI